MRRLEDIDDGGGARTRLVACYAIINDMWFDADEEGRGVALEYLDGAKAAVLTAIEKIDLAAGGRRD